MIIAGGDSFIFGSELKDQNGPNPSISTFPAILAKGLQYHCAAWPSNANNAISRMTMAACERFKDQKPFVLVTWTFLQRYEFCFTYDTKQRLGPWLSINSWTADNLTESQLKKRFFNYDPITLEGHLKNIKTASETGIVEFASAFFKHVGNSEYYELYNSLKEFVFLQNYFKLYNIPYLMIPADNHFYKHPNFVRSQNTYLNNLYDQIDWDCWYFFPAGSKANETQEPRGFYQWAVENKYPIGTTHPLEEAHAAAAELIKEKFNELVTKSMEQTSTRN